MSKPKIKKFSFAGFDPDGHPIIHADNGRQLTVDGSETILETDLPAESKQVATLVIYHQNPTWVCIGGRCYRVG